MTRARLLLFLGALFLLSGCAPLEPIGGCLLAAANRREVLRARAYLHPAIRARILELHFTDRQMSHVALVYRLTPEGWFAYDDATATQRLRIADAHLAADGFPEPLTVARAAFPGWPIAWARWLDSTR